jgi:hypothetical protein
MVQNEATVPTNKTHMFKSDNITTTPTRRFIKRPAAKIDPATLRRPSVTVRTVAYVNSTEVPHRSRTLEYRTNGGGIPNGGSRVAVTTWSANAIRAMVTTPSITSRRTRGQKYVTHERANACR